MRGSAVGIDRLLRLRLTPQRELGRLGAHPLSESLVDALPANDGLGDGGDVVDLGEYVRSERV
jgi:hypothetical protein